MSLAQRFERRLESLVGSAFARVFKGQVEPVEIGAALQREAADKRNVFPGSGSGEGSVMCPNRYRVTLSPSDHERLLPWEAQLTVSLAELVQEHLDENGWTTIGDVEVILALDPALHTGVFGVSSRMEPGAPPRSRPHDSLSIPIAADPMAGAVPPPPPVYQQPVGAPVAAPNPYAPPPAFQQPVAAPYPPQYAQPVGVPEYADAGSPERGGVRTTTTSLVVDGTSDRLELRVGANLVGRGTEADLQLLDQGVSRRHVEVDFDGVNAICFDLGSTNGTTVNGHEIGQQAVTLQHGDVIRIGHTRLVYTQEAS
ncbi:FhaA domain-containing protein [Jatrophihabitans sp. YIM 134969]